MQTSTIVVLACLLAVVVAQAHQEPQPVNTVHDPDFDTPAHESSPRNKRGLLLLKKKLILGALGLKAAKVGVGAGVVGALALKAKSKPKSVGTTYYHHGW
ncbi:uncharacterized protein LOC113502043 isoform X2 [Trichoplusia ni]|uniref:Uncharacterized protein LOC113502043 isoform X2 n=1 Tax=Trichoplusia ni TaxID=7111 RepID=A0A7E5WEU9_TRINI|nr:uncharacterized protein LOC113502043 isoform X2 [Trichoplusia ni]